jgi:hypothetical protein
VLTLCTCDENLALFDEDLDAMAGAWPNLESLELPLRGKIFPILSRIIDYAISCPQLLNIAMGADLRGVLSISEDHEYSQVVSLASTNSLREMQLRVLGDELDGDRASSSLSRLLPRLRKLTLLGTTCSRMWIQSREF